MSWSRHLAFIVACLAGGGHCGEPRTDRNPGSLDAGAIEDAGTWHADAGQRRSALASPVDDRFALVLGGRNGLSDLLSAEFIDTTTGESRFSGSPRGWSFEAQAGSAARAARAVASG